MASILTVIGRKDKKYGETLKASINRLIFPIEVLITFQRVSVISSIVRFLISRSTVQFCPLAPYNIRLMRLFS